MNEFELIDLTEIQERIDLEIKRFAEVEIGHEGAGSNWVTRCRCTVVPVYREYGEQLSLLDLLNEYHNR